LTTVLLRGSRRAGGGRRSGSPRSRPTRWSGRRWSRLSRCGGLLCRGGQPEPVEPVPTEREEIRELTDGGKGNSAEELHGHVALPAAQVQLDRLGESREVVDADDHVGAAGALLLGAGVLAGVRQHGRVGAPEV